MCSTTITGVLVIGSFKKFPVSIIALVCIFLLFIFISISQYISFADILFFTILKPIMITINAIIADINITLNDFEFSISPLFFSNSCGFTTYINANAAPPNTNDVK